MVEFLFSYIVSGLLLKSNEIFFVSLLYFKSNVWISYFVSVLLLKSNEKFLLVYYHWRVMGSSFGFLRRTSRLDFLRRCKNYSSTALMRKYILVITNDNKLTLIIHKKREREIFKRLKFSSRKISADAFHLRERCDGVSRDSWFEEFLFWLIK